MSNALLESLWARVDTNIGSRIKQISELLTQALSANTESTSARDIAVAAEQTATTAAANAASSESVAKSAETAASGYAETAQTSATEAVEAKNRAVEIAGGDFATIDYVDQRVPITGTGSPERNVAAPVGTIYTDTAATNGAVRWIKTGGTDDTGWEVEWGDTGWRTVTDDLINGWVASGVHVRRVGRLVQFRAYLLDGRGATSNTFLKFPVGFGNQGTGWYIPLTQGDTLLVSGTRNASLTSGKFYFNGGYHMSSSVITTDSWPTTLPGNPS